MRNPFFIAAVLLTVLVSGCDSTGPESEPDIRDDTERPNILILFTDDQRYNTVHALGNDEIRTPSMDRLATEGTAFTRAHIMGGMHGALCAPSRAMLMTGRRLFDLQESGDVIPEEHAMMPSVFASAGYNTFGTGKWHNNRQAFARAFQDGDNIYFGGMHWPNDGGHEAPWLHHYDQTGVYPDSAKQQMEPFSSTLFADAAIKFIRSRKETDPPFFSYVAFSSPHDPRTPPEPYNEWYPDDGVTLPANFAPEHAFDNGELKVRDELLLPHPRTEEAVKKDLAAYYGMVSEVDAQIGRILDALEATGLYDNTVIVFAGDNGLAVGSHGLLGKQNLYDHSMRVPLIIAGPGIPKGERREALVYLFDLFPTLAELAGVALPSGVSGRSLTRVLKNPNSSVRDAVFYAYRDIQRGVRDKDNWKLIRYDVKGETRVQLFNLNDDPMEMVNLADDPAFASQRARMDSLLILESSANNDRLDLTAPAWGKLAPEKPGEIDHLAVGANVVLVEQFSSEYPGNGVGGLVDGITCTQDFKETCWHAFEGGDLDATIDLGEERSVRKIQARFMRNIGAWIFLPTEVSVSVSTDNIYWDDVGMKPTSAATETDPPGVVGVEIDLEEVTARYVRVQAKNQGVCPTWHAGAGSKAWLFVDEIVVE